MTTRYQATPRSRAWAPERPSRWRPWLGALLLFVVVFACGLERVG